ncbi:MAG: S-methyl-5'-thioadenosine phosphorylase [Alphaproteobacteria bacterium]|nr:S-methyl-5'-thioadenosine phosphorylase [Alphaproteobacteria bacterium]
MTKTVLGFIGGSGIYDLPEITNKQWVKVESPWGEPSDELLIAEYKGMKLVFLPRHGRGHKVSPTDINYRANIDVLKRAGVTDLISLSAVGSLKEEYAPGDFVIIDQFIDRTVNREKSFFGSGCVAHVSLAYPISPNLQKRLYEAAQSLDTNTHLNGTYLAMEGPQFSSLAESNMYRAWGCDVIGMTNQPEAKLAREAEICYAAVSMVTDYDCWHPDHGEVEIPQILAVLKRNNENASKLVLKLLETYPKEHEACSIGSDRALEFAIMTAPEHRDPKLIAKLDAIAGRVL